MPEALLSLIQRNSLRDHGSGPFKFVAGERNRAHKRYEKFAATFRDPKRRAPRRAQKLAKFRSLFECIFPDPATARCRSPAGEDGLVGAADRPTSRRFALNPDVPGSGQRPRRYCVLLRSIILQPPFDNASKSVAQSSAGILQSDTCWAWLATIKPWWRDGAGFLHPTRLLASKSWAGGVFRQTRSPAS